MTPIETLPFFGATDHFCTSDQAAPDMDVHGSKMILALLDGDLAVEEMSAWDRMAARSMVHRIAKKAGSLDDERQ